MHDYDELVKLAITALSSGSEDDVDFVWEVEAAAAAAAACFNAVIDRLC